MEGFIIYRLHLFFGAMTLAQTGTDIGKSENFCFRYCDDHDVVQRLPTSLLNPTYRVKDNNPQVGYRQNSQWT